MKFPKRTIDSLPIDGDTVLVRVDYNVPLTSDGKIDDDLRIRASVPTIRQLLSHGCKVVIVSHLGRPEGRDPRYTLETPAARLAILLGEPVRFIDQTIGDKVRLGIKRAPKRSVTVLENLRYHAEEEENDMDFAKQLARDSGARYFVQDGFGVVHRAHASTSAITHYLPSVGGLLLQTEYEKITSAMHHPKRPFVAVVGGAKVDDKIAVVREFINKADKIIIGGAMANTFLASRGYSMGASKCEYDQMVLVDRIYQDAVEIVGVEEVDEFIILPSDLAVAKKIEAGQHISSVSVAALEPDDIALDIGNESIEAMIRVVEEAHTVVWNGTLGYAEIADFARASTALAAALSGRDDVESVIGGGDTADFVLKWDEKKGGSFSHVSTGGGASLKLMAGEKLPGIESLLDA